MKLKIYFFSIAKKCGTLIKQTHTKSQKKAKERTLTQAAETVSFKPPILFEGRWMVGLKILELCDSLVNITNKYINSNFMRKL